MPACGFITNISSCQKVVRVRHCGVSSRTGDHFITSSAFWEIKCGIDARLTEQLALLELLIQQRADLAVLSALVKLLLHLLRPLLVQDVLLFGGLQEKAGHNV